MLVPVACFTCGEEISSLWKTYQELVWKYGGHAEKKINVIKPDKNMLTSETPEAKALRDLGLNTPDRICCARMLLSHVDIVDDIS